MVWISIEGSIGCGKSTLIRNLQYKYDSLGFSIVGEPLNEWNDCLDLFYKDKRRYAFLMQTRTALSFQKIANSVVFDSEHFTITERSFLSTKLFSEMLHKNDYMNSVELNTVMEFNDLIKKPDYMFYLRTPAEICHQRLKQRVQTGDNTIQLKYLQELEECHDRYFTNNKKDSYVIDGSKDETEVFDDVCNIINGVVFSLR